MDELAVPGARLHTEVRGEGPVLLLIHGGNGGKASYDGIAGPLAPAEFASQLGDLLLRSGR